MNDQLLHLVLLQDVHAEILKTQKESDEIPQRIHQLEAKLREVQNSYATHKAELEEAQALRRTKEAQATDSSQKLKENNAKQYHVKTTKEFEAIKAENTALTESVSTLENETIALMEKIETLTKTLAEEKAQVEAEAKTIEGDKRRLLAIKATLDEEIQNLQVTSKEIASQLPPNYVSLFSRVAQRRAGMAVVECIEGICSGCQMKNRLQVWNEIARNDRVMQCFSCQRIVYKMNDKVAEARRTRFAGARD